MNENNECAQTRENGPVCAFADSPANDTTEAINARAEAVCPGCLAVDADLLEGPDRDHKTVKRLKAGSAVQIARIIGEWAQVCTDDAEGWLPARCIRKEG